MNEQEQEEKNLCLAAPQGAVFFLPFLMREAVFTAFYQKGSGIDMRENRLVLEEMKNVDPGEVDRSKLVQIGDVKVDPKKKKDERIADFVRQIKNPYCYLDGKTVVKISFSDTDRTIEDCISDYLRGA